MNKLFCSFKQHKQKIGFFTILWLFAIFDQLCRHILAVIPTSPGYWQIFIRSLGFAVCAFLLCINLPRKTKWFAAAGLTVSFTIDVVMFWCQRTFSMTLDGDLIFILSENDYETCCYFCRSHLNFKTLVYFIFLGSGIWLIIRIFKHINNIWSWKKAIISAVIIPVVLVCINGFKDPKIILCRSAVGYFCSDMIDMYCEYWDLAKTMRHPELPANIRSDIGGSAVSKQGIGVVVIGDGASRNYMSLYGYSRKTTPELDRLKDELYTFTNCQTFTGGTGIALRHIATQKLFDIWDSKDKCSFIDIYRAAGWRIVFLSTPPRWGRWATVESLLFTHADKKIYLQEVLGKECYDDHLLLPFFEKELEDCTTPTLFVFHLYGNHFPFRSDYPQWFDSISFNGLVDESNSAYSPEIRDSINRYCNSLRWTDIFLGKILKLIDNKHQPSFFVYLSDHGESVKTSEFRRMDEKDTIVIPLTMWFSEEYKQLFPERLAHVKDNLDAAIEIDRLFWNFVYMGTVDYDGFPEEHNLFSKKYKPSEFHFFNPKGTKPNQ